MTLNSLIQRSKRKWHNTGLPLLQTERLHKAFKWATKIHSKCSKSTEHSQCNEKRQFFYVKQCTTIFERHTRVDIEYGSRQFSKFVAKGVLPAKLAVLYFLFSLEICGKKENHLNKADNRKSSKEKTRNGIRLKSADIARLGVDKIDSIFAEKYFSFANIAIYR